MAELDPTRPDPPFPINFLTRPDPNRPGLTSGSGQESCNSGLEWFTRVYATTDYGIKYTASQKVPLLFLQ